MKISLKNESEVVSMIDSRQWWIFVGVHSVYDEIKLEFYKDDYDGSFLTIFGPAPGPFKDIADGRFMVLNFARKDKLSTSALQAFLADKTEIPIRHRGLKQYVIPLESDIIWICSQGNYREDVMKVVQ